MRTLAPAPALNESKIDISESDLNPLAESFCPRSKPPRTCPSPSRTSSTCPSPWTLLNQPKFSWLCPYHTHELGNRCKYGSSCWYGHALELDRPTVDESVHQLLLYAATSSQHLPVLPVDDASDVKDNTRCRDDIKYDTSEDSEPELQSQRESVRDLEDPAFNDKDDLKECESACDLLFKGKQFESHIEVDDAGALFNTITSHLDTYPPHPSGINEDNVDFFKFTWANSPEKLCAYVPRVLLPQTYPTRLLGSRSDGLIFENARLANLNSTQYNGRPIQIGKYYEEKQRYKVTIIGDYTHKCAVKTYKENQHMLIKRQNIQVIQQLDVSDAYDDFVRHSQSIPDQLSLLIESPGGRNTICAFLDFQLSTKQLSESPAWRDITYCMIVACGRNKMTISRKDCPQIVSLLYALCFEKESTVCIWKKYLIPSSWSLRNWPTFGIPCLVND